MTITAENPAASTADDDASDARRAEIQQLLDRMKAEGDALLEGANKTLDPDDAVSQGVAALDVFEKLSVWGKAINQQVGSDGSSALDLDELHATIVKQNPQAFIVTTPYKATRGIHQWTCTDTLVELRGATPRKLEMFKPVPAGDKTWSDYFAGAGGSSSGIRMVPGALVKLAVNHWPLAIETHNYNHPDTDHDQASLARTDPSRYPRTMFAWFSPECTYWSVARGDKCDYDMESGQLALDLMDEEDDSPEARDAKWRSRMLMRDVVRFSRHHQYEAVIVENVPDILKWAAMGLWLAEMAAEGYKHKIITLNSAFAGALGQSAPQLRDRVYVVFWKARHRTPNFRKWLSPKAYCPSCGEIVESLYNPKPGPRRPMRYGPRAQYTYRCPKKMCAGTAVQPMVRPAYSAIDFSLPTQRIGDRKRPLAAKTYNRVKDGVEKFWGPLITPAGGSRNNTAYPASQPMRTQMTRENEALVMPMEGRGPVSSIKPVSEPFRTATGRHQDALVMPYYGRSGAVPASQPLGTQMASAHHALLAPESFLAPLRNNGNPEPTTRPMRTFAAGGYHHALVMRNNSGGAEMTTPAGDPMRTLTTAGHQSLIEQEPSDDSVLFSYDTGLMRPLAEPLPAQTTVEGDAVVSSGGRRFVSVDDCYLRMLAIEEIRAGMAFADGYVLLGKSKRNRVKMLGNAVTPNAARDLAAMVMEAVTGDEIPLFETDKLLLP